MALSRTTLAVSPRTPLDETCKMPAVTSMIEPDPPNVLPVLVSTIVPAPDLVSTMAAAPVEPPLMTPERVSPCVREEMVAVETV